MSALGRHRKTSRPINAKNVRNARAFMGRLANYARRFCRAELGIAGCSGHLLRSSAGGDQIPWGIFRRPHPRHQSWRRLGRNGRRALKFSDIGQKLVDIDPEPDRIVLRVGYSVCPHRANTEPTPFLNFVWIRIRAFRQSCRRRRERTRVRSAHSRQAHGRES